MSSQAHELNVRTSRRLLVERSNAELLGQTYLGAAAGTRVERANLTGNAPRLLYR